MIETTINMNVITMEKINKISSACNISKNKVIKKLLKMVMSKDLNSFPTNRCVKYQESDSKENWQKFHLLLDVDEYEYFIDLRKFFKMSVSAIVAYSVNKYFKKLMKSKIKTIDNYLFKNYILIKETINNVITWRLFWGYPEKIEKILNTQQ